MSKSIRHPVVFALAMAVFAMAALLGLMHGVAIAAPAQLPTDAGPTRSVILDAMGPKAAVVITPSTFIDICTQHAPKCPLDEATWPGAPGEWQFTGKRWVKNSGTPPGRDVIWEWSMPYSGTNPAFAGQRENHYADYSSNPTGSPDFSASVDAYTYDWERWIIEPNNLRWMQMGNVDENASMSLGESDCVNGAYYPVIDHNTPWAYTDLYATQFTQNCGGGGYVLTKLDEEWGTPLSEERVVFCDNPRTGIPASENALGNAVCKMSPHVGRAQQRYAFGAVPGKAVGVGCEVVIYAWGWDHQPVGTTSGQDYEAYFRNGELRFSRYYGLGSFAQGTMPDVFDDAWWNPKCDLAWTGITNAVYSGVFKIGSTVYTDSIHLPGPTVIQIDQSGGTITNTQGQLTVDFPPNTFTETVTITLSLVDIDNFYPLQGVNRAFSLSAVSLSSGEARQPGLPFTVTVGYADYALGVTAESSLALYHAEGEAWVLEPSSQAITAANQVSAVLNRTGAWAIFGSPHRIFLPSGLR